jgi:hypothetical protein
MSLTNYDVACDKCERGFAIDDVFNVEYNDGTMNVLCENCVGETIKQFDDVASVWQ